MKKSTRVHSIVLLIILIGGLVAFFSVGSNAFAQRTVGIALSVAYALWGIIHHILRGDFHVKIVIEYVLIALIACTLFIVVIP